MMRILRGLQLIASVKWENSHNGVILGCWCSVVWWYFIYILVCMSVDHDASSIMIVIITIMGMYICRYGYDKGNDEFLNYNIWSRFILTRQSKGVDRGSGISIAWVRHTLTTEKAHPVVWSVKWQLRIYRVHERARGRVDPRPSGQIYPPIYFFFRHICHSNSYLHAFVPHSPSDPFFFHTSACLLCIIKIYIYIFYILLNCFWQNDK